jgi:hypothetical protein
MKHATNGGQESQHKRRTQGHTCQAFIRRATLEITSSQEPALYQLDDVKVLELPSRSPFRTSTSGIFLVDGNHIKILHGAPENRCRLHFSNAAFLDADEISREIKVVLREGRSPRLKNLELCLQACDPRVRAAVLSGSSIPTRPPKFECNEAGLLWHAGLYDSGSYLLISVVLDLPFLASRGIRTVKDVLRLRTLRVRELLSRKELEQLPLTSGFCSSLQELAGQFDKALRELWW